MSLPVPPSGIAAQGFGLHWGTSALHVVAVQRRDTAPE